MLLGFLQRKQIKSNAYQARSIVLGCGDSGPPFSRSLTNEVGEARPTGVKRLGIKARHL